MKNTIHQFRISQEDMDYLYTSAQGRMKANPDAADRFSKIIQEFPRFKTEKEALQRAIKLIKESQSDFQIWAKIEKGDDGIYRVQNWWIVTDDAKVKQAAEYIGMALMYDDIRFSRIISDNVKLDDVVSYW